jgi:sugar/nucleoside kinase (ribokinase family)
MSISERTGILAAGNWIVDHIKVVDVYPVEKSLANIKREALSNGGAPFNVLQNLSRLGVGFPLRGIGLLGDDHDGHWIREECRRRGINSDSLKCMPGTHTSYTDVMTVETTGHRTFFHQRGANAYLAVHDINIRDANEKVLHLGYLLLLDELDKVDNKGMTGAARILRAAKESGLQTSVDTVSEDSHRFKDVIIPALAWVDYLFINEFEAGRCTGVDLSGEIPDQQALRTAAQQLLSHGVREWVLIHFPKGVFALSWQGEEIVQGAVKLPKSDILSTVGAGDAFAAGCLLGIHDGWEMQHSIQLGVCVAAACLQDVSCSGGIRSYQECTALGDVHSFHTLYQEKVHEEAE